MTGDDVAVVAAMFPRDGLDWAKLMADPAARRRYRAATEPLLTDDFEMLPVQPEGASRTVIVGVEAYLAGMRAVMEAFRTFRITAESFVPLDGGVLVFARLEGETIEGQQRFYGRGGAIFDCEGGLIRRIREFDDRRRLLDAAGITADEARRRSIPAGDRAGG